MSDLDRRDDATAAVAAAVSAAPSSHRHGQPAIAGQLRHPSPGRQGSLVQAGEPMPGGAAATAVAETAHPIGDGSGGGDGSWPAADAHCDGASASPIEDGGASATSEQKRATASQKPVVLKANKNSFLKGTGKGLPAPKKQKTDGARDKGIKGNGDNDKDKDKPRYLREMEKYKSMSCSADTKHDRPLVK